MLRILRPKGARWALLGGALAAGCGDDTTMGQNPPLPMTIVSATVEARGVPMPDYRADTTFLTTKVDALGAFQVGGQLMMTYSNQPAQMYVLTTSAPGTTASSVDAAYQAGPQSTISSGAFDIPGSVLGVAALPAVKYLILANSLVSFPLVRSYQVLSFQFAPP